MGLGGNISQTCPALGDESPLSLTLMVGPGHTGIVSDPFPQRVNGAGISLFRHQGCVRTSGALPAERVQEEP